MQLDVGTPKTVKKDFLGGECPEGGQVSSCALLPDREYRAGRPVASESTLFRLYSSLAVLGGMDNHNAS